MNQEVPYFKKLILSGENPIQIRNVDFDTTEKNAN